MVSSKALSSLTIIAFATFVIGVAMLFFTFRYPAFSFADFFVGGDNTEEYSDGFPVAGEAPTPVSGIQEDALTETAENIFDPQEVVEGDTVAGLTVEEVEQVVQIYASGEQPPEDQEASTERRVHFSGTITIRGQYEYDVENNSTCVINITPDSIDQLPLLDTPDSHLRICFTKFIPAMEDGRFARFDVYALTVSTVGEDPAVYSVESYYQHDHYRITDSTLFHDDGEGGTEIGTVNSDFFVEGIYQLYTVMDDGNTLVLFETDLGQDALPLMLWKYKQDSDVMYPLQRINTYPPAAFDVIHQHQPQSLRLNNRNGVYRIDLAEENLYTVISSKNHPVDYTFRNPYCEYTQLAFRWTGDDAFTIGHYDLPATDFENRHCDTPPDTIVSNDTHVDYKVEPYTVTAEDGSTVADSRIIQTRYDIQSVIVESVNQHISAINGKPTVIQPINDTPRDRTLYFTNAESSIASESDMLWGYDLGSRVFSELTNVNEQFKKGGYYSYSGLAGKMIFIPSGNGRKIYELNLAKDSVELLVNLPAHETLYSECEKDPSHYEIEWEYSEVEYNVYEQNTSGKCTVRELIDRRTIEGI